MNSGDADLGSSGLLLVPNTGYVLGGGKQGILYLADTINGLGSFHAAGDQVRQEFQAVYGKGTSHIHGTPSWFNSAVNGPTAYVWGENDVLRAYPFNATTGLMNPTPLAMSTMTAPVVNNDRAMPGGFTSISANGNTNGILWASTPYNGDASANLTQGVLYAFDANTLNLLWTDKTNDARDEIGVFAKYVQPVVANGKMYIPNFTPVSATDGSGNLVAYGLLKATLTVTANNATRAYGAVNPAFTGTVTGAQGADTFTETFTTPATVASDVGTYPLVPSAAGTNLGNYNLTATNGVLTVTAEATATVLNAPSSSAPGAAITLTAAVTAAYGVPAGTVTFYNGAASLGTGTLAGGVATLSTAALPNGTDAVTAVYGAAGDFAASNSPASNVVVSPGAQTISFPVIATRSVRQRSVRGSRDLQPG